MVAMAGGGNDTYRGHEQAATVSCTPPGRIRGGSAIPGTHQQVGCHGMGVQSKETIRLTDLTSCGGCAAKWGASLLGELLSAVPAGDDGLLVGLAPSDDAAVARLSDGVALVSTTDFFPPLVDDPS